MREGLNFLKATTFPILNLMKYDHRELESVLTMANSKPINVYTNASYCDCGLRFSGFFPRWNHLLNSCRGLIQCRCGEVVRPSKDHEETCAHHAKPVCSECGMVFKNEDKYANHLRNSKCGKQMKAQSFGSSTVDELRSRCRDNTYRRRLVKNLILHTDFWKQNSLLRQLDLPKWPAFKETSPQSLFKKYLLRGGIECIVHLADRDAVLVWKKISPYVEEMLPLNRERPQGFDRSISGFEAQLGFNLNHKFSVSDPNLSTIFSAIAGLISRENGKSFADQLITIFCKFVILFRMDWNDWVSLSAWILDAATTLGVLKEMANALLDRVKIILERPVAQSFGTTLFKWGEIFITTVATLLFKQLPPMDVVGGLLKTGNLARGITNIWQLLDRISVQIFPRLYAYFTGYPYDLDRMQEQFSGIRDWYDRIQSLIDVEVDEQIALDKEICIRIQMLYREGLQYATMAQELKLDVKCMSALNTHLGIVRSLYDKVQSSGAFNGGPRMEPLIIHLFGRSGVGKSSMTYPLAIDLLKVKGIPNGKWTQEIYSRATEQEFWDGYKNQRIVMYDDFGQMVDSAGNPNLEFFEIIRTANVAPYPLHMASLLEKSKTFFTSEIVILTSNTAYFNPASLTCPEAVRRRLDISVEVDARPEFMEDGRISATRVMELTGKPLSMDPYIFHKLNEEGERTNEEPMNYAQFLKWVKRKYIDKFTRTEDLLRIYAQRAAEPRDPVEDDPFARLDETLPQEPVLNVSFVSAGESTLLGDPQRASTPDSSMDDAFLTDNPFRGEAKAQMFGFFCKSSDEQASESHSQTPEEPCNPYVNHGLPLWPKKALGRAQRIFNQAFREPSLPGGTWTDEEIYDLVLRQEERAINEIFTPDVVDFLDKARLRLYRIRRSTADDEEQYLATMGKFYSIVRMWLYDNFEFVVCEDLEKFREVMNDPRIQEDPTVLPYIKKLGVRPPLLPRFRSWEVLKKEQLKKTCIELAAEWRYTFASWVDRAKEFMSDNAMTFVCIFIQLFPLVVGLVTMLTHKDEEVECSGNGETAVEEDQQGEIAASADPKTASTNVKRTELAASSDPRTKERAAQKTEMAASSDPKTQKIGKLRTEGATISTQTPVYSAELQADQNAFELTKKVRNNMYNISIYDGSTCLGTLRGFFIVGRIFLTVAHARPMLERSTSIRLFNNAKPKGFRVLISQIRMTPITAIDGSAKDQLLLGMPNTVHDHSDIRSSIIDGEGISATTRYNGVLITPQADGAAIYRYGEVQALDSEMQYRLEPFNKGNVSVPGDIYRIRKRYVYKLETQTGDCGSPLIAISTALPRKLIGIHVAGSVGTGVASPLNIADIERALTKHAEDEQVILETEVFVAHGLVHEEISRFPKGDFTPIGKAKYQVGAAMKTQIRPSLIHAKVTAPTTKPSALRPVNVNGEMVDPMLKGLEKSGQMADSLNLKMLDACVKDVARNFGPDPTRQRVLTDMESVTGIAGDEFAVAIKRSTSPGYPFRQMTNLPGKTAWLGKDEYKLAPEMLALMHERIDMARRNERMMTVWTDTLKDERRPIEKVNAGKTRVFAGGPIDYTLVFRKYFLGFAAAVADNRNHNEVSVGTNVYSSDWTVIATLMQTKGPHVIAGDFSNFDGTLHVQILHAIVDIINDWYADGEENAGIRRVLWREILNSIHVCGDVIYMWTHSQPSGCPLTAIINSIYNAIACRYVWMLITEGTAYHSMKSFRQHVCMVSYGDDNLLNVSSEALEFYNQITMADAFATFGMTYTDETKSGEMVRAKTLDTVQYLKRRFVWNENRQLYNAPLAMESILEIPNWIRECPDHREATENNIENACFELSIHGENVFHHWAPQYERAAKEAGLTPQILTFYEYETSELIKYGSITAKTD